MHGGVETFPVIYVIAAVNFVGDICCILEMSLERCSGAEKATSSL